MDTLFSEVKLLITDVDGVMTKGEIIISDLGHETKIFHVHDGFGIVLLLRAKIPVAVISARNCQSVTKRCAALGIQHVFQGQKNKLLAFQSLLEKLKLDPKEVAYVGDDWQDLCVMQEVGVPIAVANAVPEVKAAAKYVTQISGGEGALREVAVKILQAQKKYDLFLTEYQGKNL